MTYISNFSKGTLIRMDDIAENMNWEMFKRCEMLFNKFDIKPLRVIPNNQDPDLLKYSKEDYFGQKLKIGKIKVGKYLCMI